MSEWGVALVVVLLLAVVIVAIAVFIRLFGVYRIVSCFASDEERAVLTKSEQTNNGCLVSNVQYLSAFVRLAAPPPPLSLSQ